MANEKLVVMHHFRSIVERKINNSINITLDLKPCFFGNAIASIALLYSRVASLTNFVCRNQEKNRIGLNLTQNWFQYVVFLIVQTQ